MSIKYSSLMLTVLTALLFAACQQSGPGKHAGDENDSTTTIAAARISISEVGNVEEFPGAQLTLGNVTAAGASDSVAKDSVKISFNFNVKNYKLKHQTSDSTSQLCNNSDKGQHIHFILDNKPYVALYEPKHATTVAKNSEHYVLAFLSRSYHLSLKNKEAAVLYHFKVDENGKLQKMEDPKAPMIFYSRPKGDYLGKDTENLLLDFYVWNTTLGGTHKVKADITAGGRDTSLMITEWKPYFLRNMPMGKATIKLSLVDANGTRVEGPQTEVSRDINLSKDEPLQ
jgi:hypothetical protein